MRSGLAAAALGGLGMVVPVAASAGCEDAGGCTETAKSAQSFTQSVGVNTHLADTQTVYWQNWPLVRDRLRELGVSHIRDGTIAAHYGTGPAVAARFRETGLGLALLTGIEQAPSGPGGSGEGLQTRLNWIKSENLTPQVIGIEGSNESYNDATVIRNQQCDTYRLVKSDAALASKPVIGPSGGPPFTMTIWYDRIGDLSACLDRGNLHPYPGEDPPSVHQSRDLEDAVAWGRRTFGDKPVWVTENGYWNKGVDNLWVSEAAAGAYVPRMFMEMFRRGFERTQGYDLIDLSEGSNQALDNYGLLRADGGRKPAFIGLANTMAVVKDASPAASGSLTFGIVCKDSCHSAIRHVLLRRSSGEYILAAWSESRVWDGVRNTDTPKSPQRADLNLAQSSNVEIIDTATAAAPTASYTGVTKIDTTITDHLQLFRITPAAPAPTPSPAPPAPAPPAPAPPDPPVSSPATPVTPPTEPFTPPFTPVTPVAPGMPVAQDHPPADPCLAGAVTPACPASSPVAACAAGEGLMPQASFARSALHVRRRSRGRVRLILTGSADSGCAAAGAVARPPVERVTVLLAGVSGTRCRFVGQSGRLTAAQACGLVATLASARGTTQWSFGRTLRLRPGRYLLGVRALDVAGRWSPLQVARFTVR